MEAMDGALEADKHTAHSLQVRTLMAAAVDLRLVAFLAFPLLL